MSVADLQSNPEFQKLSAEAKAIVVEKMGASDDSFKALSPEAQKIVSDKLATRPASGFIPAEKPVEPLAPYLIDKAKKGLAGLIALPGVITDTMDSPAKFAQLGLSAITSDIPKPDLNEFSAPINQFAQKQLGVKDIQAPLDEYGKESTFNKYAGATAEFAGAGIIPGAGVVATAERKLLAAITEFASTGMSAASSVEGGDVGKAFAKNFGLTPDQGEHLGNLLGSLVGPGGVALASKGIEKGLNKTAAIAEDKAGITGLSEASQKRAAQVAATKEINSSLEAYPQSSANMAESIALRDQIPGFKPTLAQSTNAPGLIAIEKSIASKTPESLAISAQREAENTDALTNFQNQNFPESSVTPIAPVKTRNTEIANTLEANLAETQAKIEALAAKNTGEDTGAIGNRLRVLREEERNTVAQVKNAKYDSVYEAADQAGVKIPVDDIQAKIASIVNDDASVAQSMPRTLGAIDSAVKKYAPASPEVATPAKNMRDAINQDVATSAASSVEVPFQALHSMQKRAKEDLGIAVTSGNPNQHHISQVLDLINEKMKSLEGPQYGDVAAKLTDANNFNRTKYAEVFNEGLGGKMGPRAVTKFGDATQDSNIVKSLIFNKGNRKGAEDFFNIYGANPEAADLLKRGVMDMFTEATVKNGEINPALAKNFIRDHAKQLDIIPSLKGELSDLVGMNETLLARRKVIEGQQKTHADSVMGKIANTDNISETIQSALKDPKQMNVLAAQAIKTKEGAQSLATAIANEVAKEKNPMLFLSENKQSLKPVLDKLGENHFNNLAALAKGQEIAARTKAPKNVNLTDIQDIGQQTLGTPVKGILSRAMGVAKGYMSPAYAVFDVGSRYFYKIKTAEKENLISSMIYDPELANSLLRLKTNPSQGAMNNFKNYAYAHGIRVLSVNASETNSDKKQPE